MFDADYERLVLFDPQAEWVDKPGRLPHWSQANAMCWITMRLDDSIPRRVMQEWKLEMDRWLATWGIDPNRGDVEKQLRMRPPKVQQRVWRWICATWDAKLDNCHGACLLREPRIARIVADNLLYFDGVRYSIFSFVIMPNHLHLLASFPDIETMKRQCENWKRYSARRINEALGRRGRLWMAESFDHLVRSEMQFYFLLRYIADNPKKAGLRPGEFLHYQSPRIQTA